MQSLKLQKQRKVDATHRFMEAVIQGFSERPRSISSMFFYDDAGDRLFQRITELESYYLTRAEAEILSGQTEAISNALGFESPFRVIELGAGDGKKSIPFLRGLMSLGRVLDYVPVDISSDVLQQLQQACARDLPSLGVHPFAADYFNVRFPASERPTVWMYMGSNIGNLSTEKSKQLLIHLHESSMKGDQLLLGFDLQKDPKRILAAYDDQEGVTAAFNLNLLKRMNRELGANFELDQWMHYANYAPQSGEARSYLLSRQKQRVHFALNGYEVVFKAWEALHTETSRKYRVSGIETLGISCGWHIEHVFKDTQEDYAVALLSRV